MAVGGLASGIVDLLHERSIHTPGHEVHVAGALQRRLEGRLRPVERVGPEIRAAIEEQARIIIADAEREVPQPADLAIVRAEAEALGQKIAGTGSRPTDRLD